MEVGELFPRFALPDEEGEMLDSGMLEGVRYVIYFYPRDGTPGCTKEASDFTANHAKFMFRNIPVFGVSRDKPETHKRFKEKNQLKIKLLSDPDRELIDAVGAWGTKNMYGKTTEGIIRTTFIVGKDGRVEAAWKKVKVDGHADKVLEMAVSLYKGC
ncbi:MAG: peroxiredoxin [Euryarchaeota archaeon]|jgi:peroxiredoxin Q/BCP|nr:peroxiredoxin [Euryarchaeota archaeon]